MNRAVPTVNITCRRVVLCAALGAALALPSCRISEGQVDFSLAQDRVASAVDDDVIIESQVGAPQPVSAPVLPSPALAAATTAPASSPDSVVPPLRPMPAEVTNSGSLFDRLKGGKANSYTVKKVDTLNRIARAHGTTPQAIIAANKLKSPNIMIGQTLAIPGSGSAAAADKGRLSVSSKQPSIARSTAPAAVRSHTVQAGETLTRIALRYKVSPAELMKANGLTAANAGLIKVGQKLTIPAAR